MQKKPAGFIAIIATLILSAVILLVAVSNAARVRAQTQGLIEQEARANSRMLADSCGEIAIMKIGENNNYAGNETINQGGLTCTIISVTKNANTYTIHARGVSGKSGTEVEITVTSLDPLAISDWKENT